MVSAPREALVATGVSVATDSAPRRRHRLPFSCFHCEPRHLGILSGLAYVGAPKANAVVECFIRALLVQWLWGQWFETVSELPAVPHAFTQQYDEQWLVASRY
jgi:hypothetical protein